MKRLMAICIFGLILWLAASQNAAALYNYDNVDTDSSKKINKTRQWSWINTRLKHKDDNQMPRQWSWIMRQTWWTWEAHGFGSGDRLNWHRFWSWEIDITRMWANSWLSGNMRLLDKGLYWKETELTGNNRDKVNKKIYRNEFNDDLNQILKFFNPNLTKDQKKESGIIISGIRTNLKAIYAEVKSDYHSWIIINLSWHIGDYTNEFNNLSNKLITYIDVNKLTEFNKFISNKINSITKKLQIKISKWK